VLSKVSTRLTYSLKTETKAKSVFSGKKRLITPMAFISNALPTFTFKVVDGVCGKEQR
jgi:hypothetical protein